MRVFVVFLQGGCPSLETLGLRDNQLGTLGCVRVGEGLQHCASLLHLDLARNGIRAVGAAVLTHYASDAQVCFGFACLWPSL